MFFIIIIPLLAAGLVFINYAESKRDKYVYGRSKHLPVKRFGWRGKNG